MTDRRVRALRGAATLGLVLLTACSTGTAAIVASCPVSPFVRGKPLVIAHAGGNVIAPANTMIALERSVEMGADVLDLDVRMTADGVVVARHDRDLATSTDGVGSVDSTTYADIGVLDAGVAWTGDRLGRTARIPRVEDALRAFPDMMFSLEIKQTTPSMGAQLCDVIERTGSTDRVFISANDDDAAYGFQDVCPAVLLTTTYHDLDVRRAAIDDGESWCAASPIGQPPFSAGFDARRVADSHAHGSAIFVWTVNSEADLRTALAAGVDGVYTDRPDLARRIFDE